MGQRFKLNSSDHPGLCSLTKEFTSSVSKVIQETLIQLLQKDWCQCTYTVCAYSRIRHVAHGSMQYHEHMLNEYNNNYDSSHWMSNI